MGDASGRTGVLLIQLGTPDSPAVGDVRRYLREFLSDPRVLDIPGPARWLLLNAIILPTRPKQSAEAYASIWTPEGSPLRTHSEALRAGLSKRLGDAFQVELGMRYGNPSLASALDRLVAGDVDRIVVQPLFPQYAASSGGSAAERLLELAGERWNVPALDLLGEFHDDPGFVEAVAAVAAESLAGFEADHVLMSYHGLPERHVRKSDASGSHCLASRSCCDSIGAANRRCYRAQCYATSRLLARALGLPDGRWSVAFQSRLGRTPWIRPYTDEVLPQLAGQGVRRLAVLCPSFVADCLETVEEIGIRGREQWQEAGGSELRLVPCVNASPGFVDALARRIEGRA